MTRDIDELETVALKFWPKKLAAQARASSILHRLLESQEKFIAVLYIADKSPDAWKSVLEITDGMPANLFLKHLMVLADVGGEDLSRYRTNLDQLFPENKMDYFWRGERRSYAFKSLSVTKDWTNTLLNVDRAGLASVQPLSDLLEDVIMFILFASASTQAATFDLAKCNIGALIGRKTELDSFVRSRYIEVSRQISGAEANLLGNLCQNYVKDYLTDVLQTNNPNWDLSSRKIPGISQNGGRTETQFDIVVKSPTGKYCAIEVCFQFTTNSTIERKAGQAADRQQMLHESNHRIAYVIDGAGIFARRSAVSTILQHSDCTVTLRDEELEKLAQYLINNLK
jgi:hypothetical protein